MRVSPVIGVLSMLAGGTSLACHPETGPAPVTELTIGAGPAGDVLSNALAEAYSRLPGLRVHVDSTETLGNLERIQRGTIDLGFDGAGFSYGAFNHGTDVDPRPHSKLRAIAVAYPTSVQFAARADSGIRLVDDFRGRRIAVGPRGSSTDEVTQLILEAHDLSYDDVTPVFVGRGDFVAAMQEGRVDGGVVYSRSPNDTMAALRRSVEIRPIPITRDRIVRIQARSPFLLKTVVIAAGTYQGQTEDVTTVGADMLLLCRDDLPEALVHDLTRQLFDAVPELTAAHPAAASIDPDRGPATSIPLHPGAARYYRIRELLR